MASDHQRALGERLRAIRHQQGLTLQEVEERSGGEWKAVVVGSYERGDRAITVARLSSLAAFYGVPVGDLLPGDDTATAGGGDPRVVLDLEGLRRTADDDPVLAMLERFASRIALERGDYNGRVLSLRADDVRTIAAAMGREPEDLLAELADRSALLGP